MYNKCEKNFIALSQCIATLARGVLIQIYNMLSFHISRSLAKHNFHKTGTPRIIGMRLLVLTLRTVCLLKINVQMLFLAQPVGM